MNTILPFSSLCLTNPVIETCQSSSASPIIIRCISTDLTPFSVWMLALAYTSVGLFSWHANGAASRNHSLRRQQPLRNRAQDDLPESSSFKPLVRLTV